MNRLDWVYRFFCDAKKPFGTLLGKVSTPSWSAEEKNDWEVYVWERERERERNRDRETQRSKAITLISMNLSFFLYPIYGSNYVMALRILKDDIYMLSC